MVNFGCASDYCLNLLFYLIPLCLLVIDNAKRLTSSAQMIILGIHATCGHTDAKTSNVIYENTKDFRRVGRGGGGGSAHTRKEKRLNIREVSKLDRMTA